VEEASEGGKPVSYAVVGTGFDGVSGLPNLVETSFVGSSVSYIAAESGMDTSSLLDLVEEALEETSVIGILVSSAVAETSVGSVPVSCDFAETSVGVGVSLSVDGSSGMTLTSSSRGPLVLSITTDVSALSIISAAKTCMRFQPVTFSISKAIVSWYILFKDKTRLNLKEQIIVQVRH